jgi:hypothetical protein
MGSLGGANADMVHFANWKRLNETSWKISAIPNRNFNYPPYSINDSAVCYYYDPRVILPGESREIVLYLAAEDKNGFARVRITSANEIERLLQQSAQSSSSLAADLIILRDLASQIDLFISGSIPCSEDELAVMELVIHRLKSRHGLP